jgi:hypothetical protein
MRLGQTFLTPQTAILSQQNASGCVFVPVGTGYQTVCAPAPSPTPAALPAAPPPPVKQTLIGTSKTQPTKQAPRLTPQTLVRPVPNITAILAPAPSAPSCNLWQQLNGWIEEYPLIAAGALVAAYLMARKKGRR